MNNFFKYPSGSEIDVAEIFTKDNLVSITGLKAAGKSGLVELAVLNKDNDFNNGNSPTEIPDFFEIKFGNIAITMNIGDNLHNKIFINRNIMIFTTRVENINDYRYSFTLSNISDGNMERIGTYRTNS